AFRPASSTPPRTRRDVACPIVIIRNASIGRPQPLVTLQGRETHRQVDHGRLAVVPPSIAMTAPVMNVARSDARNDASSATSSGRPARFSAVLATRCGERSTACGPPDISVAVKPGQIAMARIPSGPYSSAAAFVKAMTPAFDAEYTLVRRSE